MGESAEIVYYDEVAAVGTVGNVFVSLTSGRQDVARLRQLRHALDGHFRRWPKGVATISVLEPTSYSSSVSSDEREEITRMAKDFSARGVALVIEGSGFRPAAVRTLIAGVYLVSRVAYPRKIFSSVHEAAVWLTATASTGYPGAVDVPTLEVAVEQVRARLVRRPAA